MSICCQIGISLINAFTLLFFWLFFLSLRNLLTRSSAVCRKGNVGANAASRFFHGMPLFGVLTSKEKIERERTQGDKGSKNLMDNFVLESAALSPPTKKQTRRG